MLAFQAASLGWKRNGAGTRCGVWMRSCPALLLRDGFVPPHCLGQGDVPASGPFPALPQAGEGAELCKQGVPHAGQAEPGAGQVEPGADPVSASTLCTEVPFPWCFWEVSDSDFPSHLHKPDVFIRDSKISGATSMRKPKPSRSERSSCSTEGVMLHQQAQLAPQACRHQLLLG